MALIARQASRASAASRPSVRPACARVSPAVTRRRGAPVRAANSDQSFDSDKFQKDLEANWNKTTATLQKKWDQNDEKPATVAIGMAALLALITASSVVDTIDRIPIVSNIIELIGIGVTGWFTYRYLVFGPDREELFKKAKAFVNKVF